MQSKLNAQTIPFRGGCNTFLEPALIEPGRYSMVQNFRQMHPGLKKRPGQIKLHTTADSTNQVVSLFQFSKGKITERHLFAQMGDGDVLEATNAPPTVTTGEFGTEVHNGTSSGMIPASWSNFDDTMFYSNGSNQHQVYSGQTARLSKFIVYKEGAIFADAFGTADSNIWTTATAAITSVAGGQSGNCLQIAESGGAAAGKAYRNIPTTIGTSYYLECYFKKGTADNGKIMVGTTADEDAIWDSGNLSDADWALKTQTIVATAATTRITLQTNDATAGETSLFDTLSFRRSSIADFPVFGQDYTDEVSDGVSTTVAILDSLGDLTNDAHCIFICVPVPIHTLNWTVTAANTTAAVMQAKYRKSDNTWTAVSNFEDNTIAVTGKTLGQTGTMTWTKPTDSIPSYLFNTYGYWYQLSLSSGDLDSEVEVSAVTYESSWNTMVNLWDGTLVDGVEAQHYDATYLSYFVYGTDAISLSPFATADFLYVAFADPQEALFIDPGDSPNTANSSRIDGLDYWNGSTWVTVGTFVDNTLGLTQSGFLMLPKRADGLEQKQNFNNTQYYAYWYRISVDVATANNIVISISGIPSYNLSDFGPKGLCNVAWKNRMVYAFDLNPNYIYISADGKPQVLNGNDYDIKQAGDGRSNKIVCMKPFYNELMVFQEEKGVDGGMITIFDGYSPDTFGRLTLSNKYGTMNSQTVEVIDGFNFGGESKEVGLAAFILSRYGVLWTNGKTVMHIPNFDEIRNYFDPTNTNSIRAGYESKMWLKYDSAFNVLRIGLVTGSSATVCNTFLIYDLTDMSWSLDSYAQELSAFTECEAASGTAPVLQVGGGTDDGQVYLLNSGLDDVSTAIDSYVTPEYDGGGDIIHFDEILLRMKTQDAGTITVTPSLNAIAGTAFTLDQTAETANQTIRRHKKSLDLTSQHINLKIQHNTAAQSCYLEDMRLKVRELTER